MRELPYVVDGGGPWGVKEAAEEGGGGPAGVVDGLLARLLLLLLRDLPGVAGGLESYGKVKGMLSSLSDRTMK